jgi:hypothetical protein
VKLLLDTCVISEVRHPKGDRKVVAALRRSSDEDLFVSVLTLGEIAKGIELLNDSRRQRDLAEWLSTLVAKFADRVLPIGAGTAETWGRLTAHAVRSGEVIPAVDGLIAATALEHSLVVATRNQRHFQLAGVRVFDPWTGTVS